MSITNYTDLQTEVISNSNRSDLTDKIPTFVQLAEEDMKRRLKLVDLESSANVTITSGSGTLPTDYVGARSLYWNGDERRALRYITPDRYEREYNSLAGLATYYTITGSTLKTLPQGDGAVVMTYHARLTSLSDSNLTNAVITNYPDAYFFGTLVWLYHHTRNWEAKAQQEMSFERVIGQIIRDHKEKKYAGPLEVRAR